MSRNTVSITIKAKDAATSVAQRVAASFGALRSAASRLGSQVTSTKNKLGGLNKEMSKSKKKTRDLSKEFSAFRSSMRGLILGTITLGFIRLSDAAANLENRLKLVTKSTAELARTQREIHELSQDVRSGLEATGNLYARLTRSTEDYNYSQKDVLSVTKAVTQSFIVSGASAQEANAAIIQLGQGLTSGALRGDELRSVMEQAPRLSMAIADGLGVSIGELRKLGEEGALTTEKIMDAMLSQAQRIDSEFQKMGVTWGQAFTYGWNSLINVVGAFDKVIPVSDTLHKSIMGWGALLDHAADSLRDINSEMVKTREHSSAAAKEAALLSQPLQNGNLVGSGGEVDLAGELQKSEQKYGQLQEVIRNWIASRSDPLAPKIKAINEEYDKQIKELQEQNNSTALGSRSTEKLIQQLETARDAEISKLRTPKKRATAYVSNEAQTVLREFQAQAQTVLEELERSYQRAEITAEEYFSKRRSQAEENSRQESESVRATADANIQALKERQALAESAETRREIELSIADAIREKNTRLLEIEQERLRTLGQISDEEHKAAEQIAEQRRQKEEMKASLMTGVRETLADGDPDAEYALELEQIRADYAEKLRMLEEYGASKDELEQAQAARSKALREASSKHEKQQMELRTQWLTDMVSGMGGLMTTLNQMGLQNSREGFAAYKAFATAEAVVSTYSAAQKAYEKGTEINPAMGAVYAAIAIAQGLAKVALIASSKPQGYAFGGLIGGPDQGARADNVVIRATPGEYMMDRPTVGYYGLGIMEAMRQHRIPRSALGGFSLPELPGVSGSRVAYADGGQIGSGSVAQGGASGSLTIINALDTKQLLAVVASAEGGRVIINHIASNAPRVRKILNEG